MMSYADGYPVRLIAGRLALNFVNTADWSADGSVADEKLKSLADLDIWRTAVGLEAARLPKRITEARDLRAHLRAAFLSGGRDRDGLNDIEKHLRLVKLTATAAASRIETLPLLSLVANSALAVLADPHEMSRLKLCPGHDCAWFFIDETKNARRRWCLMETCGNRAKASRHYARQSAEKRA